MGYVNGNSYKPFFPELKRFANSRDVEFNESIFRTEDWKHELTPGVQRLDKPSCRQEVLNVSEDRWNLSKQNRGRISPKDDKYCTDVTKGETSA